MTTRRTWRACVTCVMLTMTVFAFWNARAPGRAAYAQGPQKPFTAVDDLADAIAAASDADRERLLADHASLITPALVQRLVDRAVDVGIKDRARGLSAFRVAADIARGIGDAKGLSRALANIGRLHMGMGQHDAALTALSEALAMSDAAGDKAGAARAANVIGLVHHRQARSILGEEFLERAVALAEQADDAAAAAASLHNLGLLHLERGDYAPALEYYGRSLALKISLGDLAGEGATRNNMGTVYRDRGDYGLALEFYQRALALREAHSPSDVPYTLNNLGIFYKEQGHYALAIDHYTRALAKFEAARNTDGMSRVVSNLGAVYQLQGQHARALEYLTRAIAMKRELNDKEGLAIGLGFTARVYVGLGELDKAADYYAQAQAIFESLGSRNGVAIALTDRARLALKQGQPAGALDLANGAAAMGREIARDEVIWEAATVAGTAHRALGHSIEAREAFEEAIAAIESLRPRIAGGSLDQQRYFENRLPPYHALVQLLLDDGKASEALAVAERARARTLLDVLQGGRVSITKAMTNAERDTEKRLDGRLVALNADLLAERMREPSNASRLRDLETSVERARLDLERFHATLYASHPELRMQRGEVSALEHDDLRDVLDASTVLIEFVVTDQTTFAFVLDTTSRKTAGSTPAVSITTYRLPLTRQALAARVEQFRTLLATADVRFAKPARELYDLVLGPAASRLRGRTRLVIAPDGPLWDLPFQALQTPQGAYVLDERAVFTVPSIAVLRETIRFRERRAPARATILALGNPSLGNETVARAKAVLMDEPLDPLPEAERQVRSLEAIYGPRDSRLYVGADAREERFKAEAGRFRILHLATHGVLNDRQPMYSHLLLAQRGDLKTEDGLLEARELMDLSLSADVAVLSACETARGLVRNGEGLIGLTWSLFVAGVPTTVVSQWKVRSDSTAELMIALHTAMKTHLTTSARRTGVADALREAALSVRRDRRYAHPFHWAGFVVVGNGY